MRKREKNIWESKKAKLVRKMPKRFVAAGLSAALMLGLAACGAGNKNSSGMTMAAQENGMYSSGASMDYGYMEAAEAYMPEESLMDGASGSGTGSSQKVDNSAYFDERKLIKTVELQVETKEFDAMLASVEEQVEMLGGYIESMNTYNGSRYSNREYNRTSSLTVRIPRQQLTGFVNAVSEAGNVINRSENVEDVTLSYVDMESRRNSLKTEQERLQELLEVAESLEDILVIEDRLSTVRYQLESMEAQLRTYDNKVDFSTVYMSIQEVKELTPVEEETTWERIANGFTDSLMNVKDGLVDFFVWFVVSLPYLAVWAVVIFVIVAIIKLIIRRSRRKKAERIQKLRSVQPGPGAPGMQGPQPGQGMPGGQNPQQSNNPQRPNTP